MDPIELMRSHRRAHFFRKEIKSLFGRTISFSGIPDYCPNADQWYRVVDSSRDDYWITADVSRDTACEGVTDVTEQMLLSGQRMMELLRQTGGDKRGTSSVSSCFVAFSKGYRH